MSSTIPIHQPRHTVSEAYLKNQYSAVGQFQYIVETNSENHPLIQTILKIQDFVSTGKNRKDTESAIFQYIDQGTKKRFSQALPNMNWVAAMEYREYESSLKQFLDNARQAHISGGQYDIATHFNGVVQKVTGKWGVIQCAECANFVESGDSCRLL